MTTIERNAYLRFTRVPSVKELREVYTPTPGDEAFVATKAQWVILAGATCLTVALYLLSIVPRGALGLFILALCIAGLGLGSFLGTPIRYVAINEAPADQRASSIAVVSICNSIGQAIGVPLAGSMIASQTSAVIGLQHFYLFACVVLAASMVSSCFLKTRKQELASLVSSCLRV